MGYISNAWSVAGEGGWGGPNNDDFACRLCLLEAAKGGEMRLPSGRWS